MIKTAEKKLSTFANSHIVKKHIDKCIKSPQFLTNTLLATSISKDVFAYTLRVNNTLKNKEIPEDKKSFVATMDAVTRVITALVQVSAGLLLSNKKLQEGICNRLFSELKDNPKKFKQASSGFRAVSTLVGATLLAKRIIVPLISSPIAGYFENKHKQKSNSK